MNLSTFHPGYALNRIALMRFRWANPSVPWLTADAITALQDLLKADDVGFEFGSGRSTLWIARRVKFLHSVEHDEKWFTFVSNSLKRESLADKVDYRLAREQNVLDDLLPEDHPYVAGIAALPDQSLDFVLVDGIMRLTCVRLAMRKLKPGGFLILDNANVYLPNLYEEGNTTFCNHLDLPRDMQWKQTWDLLSRWRGFNATDRITDTRFWIKPS